MSAPRPAVAAGACLALALLLARAHAAEMPWAVKGAPFRVILRLKDAPSDPDVGTQIAVPDLNVGGTASSPTGYTLTDATGAPLPVALVWHGEAQDTLLLASGLKAGQDYALYVGGPRGPDWSPKTSLLMETRAMPAGRNAFTSASAIQEAWATATTLGAQFTGTIFASGNPFGEQTNFLTHYSGYLAQPDANATFYTNSSDASFVLVNGQTFIDLPGNHAPVGDLKGIRPKKLPGGLTGPVKIDYYASKAATDGSPFMTLGHVQNGKPEQIFEGEWLHPGTSEVLRAETLRGQPVPLPWVTLSSYIGVGGSYLYEVHGGLLGTGPDLDGVEWRFDDGGVFTGPRFERIMAGTPAEQRVVVQAGRGDGIVRVARRLNFAGPPPTDASEGKEGHERYLDLLTKMDPAHLDAAMLGAALPFLIEHGTDAQVAPCANGSIKLRLPITDSHWLPAEIARLRAVAVTDPAAALTALRADTEAHARYGRQLDLFEVELLVFYQRDINSASRVQQIAFGLGDTPEGHLAAVRVGDLYRLNGDVRQATLKYTAAQPPDPSNGRQLPAQDQANAITVQSLIDQGDRQEAMDKLTAWELVHPMAKLTTDFPLLRSRALALYGRWREAQGEIEFFAAAQPDSSYQIEVDFLRARALYELGKKDDARKIWLDIVKNYPKSDLAASSKEWAAKP